MKPISYQKDTNAWSLQVWISFILSVSATGVGIIYLPVDSWTRGCIGICYLYSITSAFTLAKTVRDNHEAQRLIARVEEARVEKILAEHDPLR